MWGTPRHTCAGEILSLLITRCRLYIVDSNMLEQILCMIFFMCIPNKVVCQNMDPRDHVTQI